MSAVACTLEGTGHPGLGEIVYKLVHGEMECPSDKAVSINCDSVVCPNLVLNWTVVSVIIVAFGDEAMISASAAVLIGKVVSFPLP